MQFVLCRQHPTNITHNRLSFYFPTVPCPIAWAAFQQDFHPEQLLVFWCQKLQTICGQFCSKTTSPSTSICFFYSDLKKNLKTLLTKETVLLKLSHKYFKWINSTNTWSNTYQSESKHNTTDTSRIGKNSILLTYITLLPKR